MLYRLSSTGPLPVILVLVHLAERHCLFGGYCMIINGHNLLLYTSWILKSILASIETLTFFSLNIKSRETKCQWCWGKHKLPHAQDISRGKEVCHLTTTRSLSCHKYGSTELSSPQRFVSLFISVCVCVFVCARFMHIHWRSPHFISIFDDITSLPTLKKWANYLSLLSRVWSCAVMSK